MTSDPIDSDTRRAVDLFVQGVAGHWDTVGAFLFGSRARKTHRADSDADVAVILRGAPGAFMPAMRIMDDIAFDVLLTTGIRVQPLPIWEQEWRRPERYSNPLLLANIARDGVPV